MYKLKPIKKMMMRNFLLTNNIDKIDLYVVGIEVCFYYFASYIGQDYFNAQNNILYLENLAVG